MHIKESLSGTLLISLILMSIILAACTTTRGTYTHVSPTQPSPTKTPFAPFVLHIPEKALWQNYLHVSAETTAGTACRLTYVPPMGETQQMDTTADKDGLCKWRWKISEDEGKGPGRLIFTIDGNSETHFIEIRRSF
jgi:hypothetical protein